ncbi:hypothetical protein C8A05DRAFT_37704 [Staphylotrichum tortipilum]|uniref:Uncharacterized protein n=1 Tax=Staphylotrichum tortipilum TaxID=2831512 RepID=A0AAN6MDA9_9PEZI|nr:hypothetical protein C8A05DRAFT_37704 [Staphylotrichum longicolle]
MEQRGTGEARRTVHGRQRGSLGDKFLQVVRYNSAFMQTLWLASFPGLVDLPGYLSSNLGGWLNGDKLGSSIATREGRSVHEVGRHIDTISKGSGKLEALGRCLEAARVDRAVGRGGADGRAPLKKHVCVFAARPGASVGPPPSVLTFLGYRGAVANTSRRHRCRSSAREQAHPPAEHILAEPRLLVQVMTHFKRCDYHVHAIALDDYIVPIQPPASAHGPDTLGSLVTDADVTRPINDVIRYRLARLRDHFGLGDLQI